MAPAATPVGPFPPGTTPDEYDRLRRRVLWLLPSGLYLLGSAAGGEQNLMTLNWAMQVSFEPKLVAVSVEREAVSHRLVEAGQVFSLSLLAREDRSLARRFVKPASAGPGPGQLNGFAVRAAATGAPILAQSVAWLDCRVRQQVACGGHTLFVGEVVDAGLASSGPSDGPPERAEAGGTRDGATGSGAAGAGEGGVVEVLRMEDTRMNYGG